MFFSLSLDLLCVLCFLMLPRASLGGTLAQLHLARILQLALHPALAIAERALAVVEEILRQGLVNPSDVRRGDVLCAGSRARPSADYLLVRSVYRC